MLSVPLPPPSPLSMAPPSVLTLLPVKVELTDVEGAGPGRVPVVDGAAPVSCIAENVAPVNAESAAPGVVPTVDGAAVVVRCVARKGGAGDSQRPGGPVIATVDGAPVVIRRLVPRKSGTRDHQRASAAGLLSDGQWRRRR